jgi:tetraspanin-7
MPGRIGSTLQSSPVATCVKFLLTLFNFIFWLSGVAILGLGVWMKIELYMYMELTTVYYDAAPYILIGVGCAIIVIGSFGCMCTIRGHSCLLYVFSIILMLVFIVELATAISAFIYEKQLSQGFKSGLTEAMNQYRDDEEKKDAVDGIQSGLKCCGNSNYKDWYNISWSKKAEPNKVPHSCCIKKGCDGSEVDEIYQEGCFEKLSTFMQSNFLMIGGIAIGFAFLQLFGALLACCLAKNINKAKYEQMA